MIDSSDWPQIDGLICPSVASNGMSFVLSSTLSVVMIAVMQMYRQFLSSSQPMTIFAGYLGSMLFLLVLTAISNLEMTLFGKHFQSKLTEGMTPFQDNGFPFKWYSHIIWFNSVIMSLVIAMLVSGVVHRVAITTWYGVNLSIDLLIIILSFSLIFSLIGLYYVNRISVRVHQINTINPNLANHSSTSKKRK